MIQQKWLVGVFALVAAQTAQADVLSVPGDFTTIQQAIFFAVDGDTVEVANGVFSGAGNRDINLLGKNITVRSANGPANCIIDAQGTPTVPFRGFVVENGETRDAVIEGFTIMNGATLPGAVADQFNGGGMRIIGASPTVRNCVFVDNECGCWGAALYASNGASPLVEGCLFINNAADDDGGAIFAWNSTHVEVTDSVFLNNSAPASGGAIASWDPLTLTNVTVVGNQSGSVGGVYGVPVVATNSIFWGNTSQQVGNFGGSSVAYSIVQGGFPGVGNLDIAPKFRADGFHLTMDSAGVDAGDPSFRTAPGKVDVDGDVRVQRGRVDMGADELNAELKLQR